ncbi:MAG: L,D-transpeptidase family protein [Spongiibacteraceae bacterium]|nr:L,D-transpeptidase family protein [Spongiibacteraceae bacterium]
MKLPSALLLFSFALLWVGGWTTPVLAADLKADLVVVEKSQRRLYLLRDGEPIRSYRVALGPRPWGHKQHAGDDRTPEGWYILDLKKADSEFYRAIRISYPNLMDRVRAEQAGLDPGGAIMIHGQPANSEQPPELAQLFNWTSGCIAVTNEEMDEIWAAVDVGTPIHIKP